MHKTPSPSSQAAILTSALAAPAAAAEPREDTRCSITGFSVGDVRSVRPDLTVPEAARVLRHCGRQFDASIGLNWDLIEIQSYQVLPARCVEGALTIGAAAPVTCTVNLATGSVFLAGRRTLIAMASSGAHDELRATRLTPAQLGEQPGAAAVFCTVGAGGSVSAPLEGTCEVHGGDGNSLTELLAACRAADVSVRELPLNMPR